MHIKSLVILSAASASLSKAAALPVQAEVAVLPPNNAHDGANSTLVINKRLNLQETEVGCNRKGGDSLCPKKMGLYDADDVVPQTCPRRALAAKANFLDLCRGNDLKGPSNTNIRFCTSATPTIQRCCGAWVWNDNTLAKLYPTARDHNTGLVESTKTGKELQYISISEVLIIEDTQMLRDHTDWIFRKAIKPNAWQYNFQYKECSMWVPTTEAEFQYWYQNLLQMEIDEVYETKESNEPRNGPPNDH